MSTIVLNDPIIKDRVINVTLDNIKGEYNNNEYTLISRAYEVISMLQLSFLKNILF